MIAPSFWCVLDTAVLIFGFGYTQGVYQGGFIYFSAVILQQLFRPVQTISHLEQRTRELAGVLIIRRSLIVNEDHHPRNRASFGSEC